MAMLLVLHLMICVVLVGAVLMQRSEGGALGMGGGGAGGLISGRGAADMMVNITSWAGGAFFVTSLLLAVMAGTRPADRSVIPENGAQKSGFHLAIPGFPAAPAVKPAPAPIVAAPLTTPAPAVTPGTPTGATAPAPVEAVTRAGPLEAQPAPVVKTPVGAVTKTGAAPPAAARTTSTPVGAPEPTATKAPAVAPMIPLPAATVPPAPAAESGQPPVPAPAEKQKNGPDQ